MNITYALFKKKDKSLFYFSYFIYFLFIFYDLFFMVLKANGVFFFSIIASSFLLTV